MRLFGFEFKRQELPDPAPSFAPKEADDGAVVISAGGAYGTYIDLDGTVRTEAELVTKYREMSLQPEIDSAIDEITNECIEISESKIVNINLDDLDDLSDKIKKLIRDEFSNTLKLLNFNKFCYETFRRWYIDGRLYYHVIIDENDLKAGVKELRYVDPRKIRKVREIVKKKVPGGESSAAVVPKIQNEYYIFNDKGFNYGNKTVGPSTTGLKIAKDSVIHVVSGLTDTQGTMVLSYLHKGIKALNQLRTLEDALVIYRLARAPERRIWYIDVGNLPKMKAEQYVRDIMVKHKNRLIYDGSTGEVRDDRKFMCYSMDTKIPILDGRTLTLDELKTEYETGKQNWVYSCDPITGKFVPGPVSWAGVTKRNSEVVKVTFDNGKSVICTPDHKFPVWGKGFVEAKDLVGESIIPGYRRMKAIITGGIEYEQIFKNDTKTWEYTHREVSAWKKDYNLEEEFIFSDEYASRSKQVIDQYGNIEIIENLSKFCRNHELNLNRSNIKSKSGSYGYHAEKLRNHKAISVEWLDEKIDVGCITVDLEETYHSHHTYLLDAGVYTKNTMLEDYWLPRREGGRGTEVTTLPGGQTLGEMDDVLYFQKKLYQTLNVPVNRLNSDALFSLGRATEVTRDEVKFSKFITRLRGRFSVLFNQVLEKQVVLKGIMSIEDWQKISPQIKYDYAKDNYFTELKDTEILQNRAQLLMSFEQGELLGKYYSYKWARRNILQQSDDEIETQDEQIEEEANSDDERWASPRGIDDEENPIDQQDMTDNQDTDNQNPDLGSAKSSDKTTNEKLKEAQATIDRIGSMNSKLRTLQDEADYRSAIQILARNK